MFSTSPTMSFLYCSTSVTDPVPRDFSFDTSVTDPVARDFSFDSRVFFWAFSFWEGLSLQAKQRSAPPKKPRACLSQAPTKRGVCASLPAALLPVDATHVATVPSTPAAISAKPPAVARPTGV